ncbi:hypothetical protein B0B51_02965 [blood disease bacterium A2-HR MARDI]|uniref:Uncharacterized protein n=1 Tax=blood disease bacterium A2-HR MARDI TaxID=1944648 RepID=A0A1U9VEG9_9RALS|nr:hypothetical protein B0B51_02965 [blood disease bacterium A2-HR MARDI]
MFEATHSTAFRALPTTAGNLLLDFCHATSFYIDLSRSIDIDVLPQWFGGSTRHKSAKAFQAITAPPAVRTFISKVSDISGIQFIFKRTRFVVRPILKRDEGKDVSVAYGNISDAVTIKVLSVVLN